jgi:hypothetical protein
MAFMITLVWPALDSCGAIDAHLAVLAALRLDADRLPTPVPMVIARRCVSQGGWHQVGRDGVHGQASTTTG